MPELPKREGKYTSQVEGFPLVGHKEDEADSSVAKQSFGSRMARGFFASFFAAIPLAMGVTVVDRSVTQYANGSAPSIRTAFVDGVKQLFKNPIKCLKGRDTLAVAAVYVPTYITKNLVEASCDYQRVDPFWYVFFIATTLNTSIGIMKDRYLAQMFGSGIPNFPKMSYGLFALRDTVIVGSSFQLPIVFSPILQKRSGWSKEICDNVTQLACPGLAQFVGTPIHLIGLDLYNRPEVSTAGRFKGLFQRTMAPLGVRIIRQVYVFGVGGILVKKFSKFCGFNDPTLHKDE